jgi:hypothetical protein
MKTRLLQITLIASFFGVCWLLMQVVHELGHIAFTVLPGGEVERIVLHPLTFSRTDVSANPCPLLQIWGGPVVGVVLPIACWGMAYLIRASIRPFLQLFAGFCCIVNGAYIGFAPNSLGLDTHTMLAIGSKRWHLLVFGISMLALGLWLWNGTGKVLGFGVSGGEVSSRHVIASVCLLVAVVIIELILNVA